MTKLSSSDTKQVTRPFTKQAVHLVMVTDRTQLDTTIKVTNRTQLDRIIELTEQVTRQLRN